MREELDEDLAGEVSVEAAAGRRTETAAPPLRRQGSLVPQRSIAGRSLVMVIAIMTFLASLAAGAAHLVSRAAGDWTSSISSELSIEVTVVGIG